MGPRCGQRHLFEVRHVGTKYFTASYDDGLEQDRRIIALMQRYGIRGTFNLCSGLFGQHTYLERKFGDYGFATRKLPENGWWSTSFWNRKRRGRSTGMWRSQATGCTTKTRRSSPGRNSYRRSKGTGRKNLENLFERPVFGHIVPYGAGNEKVFAAMRGRDFCTGEKPPSRKSRGTFAFTSTPRA